MQNQFIMKRINYVCLLSMLFTLLYSCESKVPELETSEAKEVFTIGEVQNSASKKGGLTPNCGIFGPLCASPNQSITFTYFSPDLNPAITWTVTGVDVSIASGQGTHTVTINLGGNFSGGSISVIGVGPANCSAGQNILLCGTTPVGCTTYHVGILDEYIDGTQSGANFVYLHAGGNFPVGTTYAWEIKRQDGSIQLYSASTTMPRLVSASINNRITQATVTASYLSCTRTVTNIFNCAIPNSDINGYLFPECY